MLALKQELPTITKEAYFDYREHHDGKYELHDGMIVAMAGGTTTHTRLGGNAFRLLADRVEPNDCEAFVFEKSVAAETDTNYYYPDVVVVCGEAKYDHKANLLNPVVIVEVLSSSTALYDRNTKFERYRDIPTFAYYLLISQEMPRVEIFTRPSTAPDSEWQLTVVEGKDAEFALPLFTHSVKLSDLYRKVNFED